MLEVGNIDGATLHQEQTHFSYWAALKSPLIIGADLSVIADSSLEVLKNQDIIALNQDPLGVAPWYISSLSVDNERQVWAGPLSDGWVVLVTNEVETPLNMTVPFEDIDGFPSNGTRWNVKDLWSNTTSTLSNGATGVGVSNVTMYQTVVLKLTEA